jgi:hypothetical protein
VTSRVSFYRHFLTFCVPLDPDEVNLLRARNVVDPHLTFDEEAKKSTQNDIFSPFSLPAGLRASAQLSNG